jgi:hypothetical protein
MTRESLLENRAAAALSPHLDERLMHGAWTSHGRLMNGGGRRGSNPQLQPWEGAGPFLNSRESDNRLTRCLSTPIFERDRMAFASHHRTVQLEWTAAI